MDLGLVCPTLLPSKVRGLVAFYPVTCSSSQPVCIALFKDDSKISVWT